MISQENIMKILENKTFKNAIWIIACKIIQSILALIVNMLISRYLGPANYGIIQYAASLVAFATPFMQLGLNSILVNEILKRPNNEGETLGTSLIMSSISSIFCILGIICFAGIANKGDSETIIVCTLYSISLFFSALELIQYWFQAKLKSKYVSITILIVYVFISIYRIALLIIHASIYWFCFCNAFDVILVSLSLLVIYRKIGGPKLKFCLKSVGSLFSKSRHFVISTLMITIFAQMDKIMLKNIINETETGIYSAAITCALLSSFIFSAIIDSVRPSILSCNNCEGKDYDNKIILLFSIIVYLSIAQCILMTIFADPIINFLYGLEFKASAKVLKIGVWYTTFSYIGAVKSIWLLAENKQKYLWIINSSGAICNIVLNLCFIPYMGAMGAAIASLLSQFFTNVVVSFIISPLRKSNLLLFKSLNPKCIFSFFTIQKR